ncbi:hypothetical protein IJ556_04050 [bacterium]|nr:hypothetical protein [bacterium]
MLYYYSTKTTNIQSILENGGLELSKSKGRYILPRMRQLLLVFNSLQA